MPAGLESCRHDFFLYVAVCGDAMRAAMSAMPAGKGKSACVSRRLQPAREVLLADVSIGLD